MMNSPADDHKSASDAASAGGGANPLWLLVGASALFFALAAALLASG
jgi:hypothetical protein